MAGTDYSIYCACTSSVLLHRLPMPSPLTSVRQLECDDLSTGQQEPRVHHQRRVGRVLGLPARHVPARGYGLEAGLSAQRQLVRTELQRECRPALTAA